MSQNKVHFIRPNMDVATTLRNIADDIDACLYPSTSATLIMDGNVFSMGMIRSDGEAAANVIWDCNFAIAKLMAAVTKDL